MTSTVSVRPPASRHAVGAVLACGMVVLLARPWLVPDADAVASRVLLFATLGAAGAALPLRPTIARLETQGVPERTILDALIALLLGCVAFAGASRLLIDLPPRPDGLVVALALNALAGVAEEAFFRRLLYGWLERWGALVAVVGSAVLFAIAHATVWGLWVLPLDLAAGLLLSWQRAASGRWSVPAVTHVLANSLALL